MEPVTSAPPAVERGVLVISAWNPGAAGQMIARVTMTGPGCAPVVSVVRGPTALQELVSEWIAARGAR